MHIIQKYYFITKMILMSYNTQFAPKYLQFYLLLLIRFSFVSFWEFFKDETRILWINLRYSATLGLSAMAYYRAWQYSDQKMKMKLFSLVTFKLNILNLEKFKVRVN